MAYAYAPLSAVPVEVSGGFVGVDGTSYPPNIYRNSAEFLASIDVYQIVEPVIPDGKRIVSTSLDFVDGGVRRVAVFEDIPPPGVSDYTSAIMAHLDTVARQRQYDNALSISTYVGSTISAWAAEAAAFVAWRDTVWAYALTELAKVQAGQRTQPTVAELIAELPSIAWPEA